MRFVPRIGVHSVQGNGFKWAVVLPPYAGEACPKCGAVVIGVNHRSKHIAWHNQLTALDGHIRELSKAIRELAIEAGHGDWYPDVDPAIDGYVLGSGELPAETRGGAE